MRIFTICYILPVYLLTTFTCTFAEDKGKPTPTALAITNMDSSAEEFTALVSPRRDPQDIELFSQKVDTAPEIDGHDRDQAWANAREITTLDRSSQQEITIKSVHTKNEIFFLVKYPDKTASEKHKYWVWDTTEEIYKQGNLREDIFVFKWSMSGNKANLSIFRNPEPHEADIWFWKACRTNPSGYADDKYQILSSKSEPDARKIRGKNGDELFLVRKGDTGKSAYKPELVFDYRGDCIPQYVSRQPKGSRADIPAKGEWKDGYWTIEFSRRLDTRHKDDLAFTVGQRYLFGVSRYEISYDPPNAEFSQPLYRTGDVFDRLWLIISE